MHRFINEVKTFLCLRPFVCLTLKVRVQKKKNTKQNSSIDRILNKFHQESCRYIRLKAETNAKTLLISINHRDLFKNG